MITIIAAVFSLNSAFACEPYCCTGAGPLLLSPMVGIGARFDDGDGKMDLSLNYTYSAAIKTFRISTAKLFIGPDGIYAGPSYALSFHSVCMAGTGTESLLGFVIGKDFADSFLQIDVYKPMFWKNYKLENAQAIIKIGVKF